MSARTGALLQLGVVAVAVAAFLVLALYQYRLPGLYYDEAGDVVPAMQLLQGEPVTLIRGVGVHLFGRDFPVMIGDYWGVTSTYAVLPLFALFGFDVLPIRLFPILASAAAIVATYALGRRLFSGDVGALAALLLALSPSFIFWSRIGIYVISHIVLIALGVMLAYLSWRERPRWWKAFLGALLAGIGLTTKLLFVWFFIAVPAAFAAVLIYDWLAIRRASNHRMLPARENAATLFRRYIPAPTLANAAAAVFGLCIGAFPVLYYNVVSRGSYFLLRDNFGETERGVDNFALLDNLRQQLEELRIFLDGGYFWFLGGVFTNPLSTYVVGLSTLGLLLLVQLPEHARHRRTMIFLLTYAGAIFFLSCFSISILAATHLFILFPLPQLMIAASVFLGTQSAVRRLRPRLPWAGRYIPAIPIVAILIYAALDLRADVRYHDALRETGGLTAFSDAIYGLADYLDENGYNQPYALDWGVRPNVMILTDGRVEPIEIFGQSLEPGAAFEHSLDGALAAENPIFISQTEVSSAFPRLDRFREIVEARGGQVVLERVFPQRNGVPAYYLFRIERGVASLDEFMPTEPLVASPPVSLSFRP